MEHAATAGIKQVTHLQGMYQKESMPTPMPGRLHRSMMQFWIRTS